MKQNPKVSVCMITYAHEKFIEEAINGVLMQECNFEIELIVANDCSLDTTNKIVNNIIETHSRGHWIKYTMHSKNIGMMPNFIWALKQSKGKYIALCEGDDYWTDPLKLQKQVDFLDGNVKYGGVANNSLVHYNNGNSLLFGRKKSRIVKEEEIVRCRQFATASILFRNNLTIPGEFSPLVAGDTPLMLLITKKAPIYYENIVTSLYQRGSQGVTSNFNKDNYKKKMIEYNLYLNKFTNEKHSKIIRNKIRKIDITFFDNNKYKILFFKKLFYLDEFCYSLLLNSFKIKREYYFDIDGYPFYKKLYFRIFG